MLDNKVITITLVILLGVFVQVLLVFAEIQDTPDKAVMEFVKSYVRYNDCMADRLCEESKVVNDVDVVDEYIYQSHEKAKSLGFSPWYMKDYLKHVSTHVVKKDFTTATIELEATISAWPRSFFTGYEKHIEETFELVKEDGTWKVCGNPFNLQQYAE